MDAQPGARQENRWAKLQCALQAQRHSVGNPSYGEIADRIASARRESGVDEHAARVARSTVYDCFRPGRKRINQPLVREIGSALGVSAEQLDEWIEACHETGPSTRPTPDEPVAPTPPTHERIPPRPTSPWMVALLLVACVGLNLLGRVTVDFLHLPIYLDMVGTAVAAIALGPWLGATVGAGTNVVATLTSGLVSLPFAIVNVVGALVWGYGVHRFGWGRTLPRFFGLNILVALLCSLLAVPILVLVFGGTVGQGQDTITQTFVDLGNGLFAAVGFSNLLTSAADKLISGFTALVVVSAAPARLRKGNALLMAASQAQANPAR